MVKPKYATHSHRGSSSIDPPRRRNPWTKPKDRRPTHKLLKSSLAASGKTPEFSSLFVGHSFVRGWKYAVLHRHPHVSQGGRPNPSEDYASYQDVTPALQDQARILVEHLRVSHTYRRLYTLSKIPLTVRQIMRDPQPCVVFISDLRYLINFIKGMTPPPDSVFLAVGSNDLAGLSLHFTLADIRRLADELLDFVAQIPPRIIVVALDVVPREGGLAEITPAQFRTAMRDFNRMLHNFELDALDGRPGVPRNFRHGKLRGWDRMELPSGEQTDLRVRSWSNHRLIHPTEDNYVGKFSESLRRVMITPKNRPTYVHHL